MEQQAVDVAALNGDFSGTVVRPGGEGWDAARGAWNLVVDQHPAAVAYVESPDDVAAVIAFARSNGLRVAPQGTGHGAPPRGALDRTILVKTERMNGIEIDAEGRVGRFEAGVIWRDAGNAAAEHGLAGFPGSSPGVGVVGYTTGGGLGWLGRRHGLACNNVRAIELVTADGEFRRIDSENEPDLFWALRGGGGNFGVITAMEFNLIPLPEVYAGSVVYPADERSSEIFRRYHAWAEGVPDEITSIARFLHLPPLPDVPEPLRDRPLITLGACYAGPASEGAELIAPLLELGEPVMNLFQGMPPSQLVTVHMDPEEPVPGLVHGAQLRQLPGGPSMPSSMQRGRTPAHRFSLPSFVTPAGRWHRLPRERARSRTSMLSSYSTAWACRLPPRWARRSIASSTRSATRFGPGRPTVATSTSPTARWISRSSSNATRWTGCARSSGAMTRTT